MTLPAGTRLGPYEILSPLGAGGMGEVYRARDNKLDRDVAIKVLPESVATDSDTLARFEREAKAVAALSHPNILAIFDFGTDGGTAYSVTELLEGETLREMLRAGPVDPAAALDYALQTARGLSAAHARGIVHRDLKPENLFVTRDGQLKILDFGLAKKGLAGAPGQETSAPTVSGHTLPGTVMGTLSYMSPEQLLGEAVDQRSDLYSLGVVLYELGTRRRPFEGNSAAAISNAILHAEPREFGDAPIPGKLKAVIRRLLEKDPGKRYSSAEEVRAELKALEASLDPMRPKGLSRPARIALIAASAAAALVAAWVWHRTSRIRWVERTAIPEIGRLVAAEQYQKAAMLIREARAVEPRDPTLENLWLQSTLEVSIESTPAGADVSYRPYRSGSGAWTSLGATPLIQQRVPTDYYVWRIQKEGFAPAYEIEPTWTLVHKFHYKIACRLVPAASAPAGMTRVAGGKFQPFIPGLAVSVVPLDDFWIDRHEVTNDDFQRFVDAGGYQNREYWKEPFTRSGEMVPFEDAIATFRDTTGRPGPSTWEAGRFRKGFEEHPVAGVSWYEAAAYAAFAGKSLPTIYHWNRAAQTEASLLISPVSNFQGEDTMAVDAGDERLSGFGTTDMAGNVKEWCSNEGPSGKRFILGGGFGEPTYMFIDQDAQSPWDRRSNFGFRCVRLSSAPPAAATARIEGDFRDFSKEKPASDELFRAYLSIYAYDRTDLNARVEEKVDADDWRREKITLDAAYGGERLTVYLFLPKNAVPPYQAVVYFPGSGAITSDTFVLSPYADFVPTSGRALVAPVFKGTFERRDALRDDDPTATAFYRDHLVMWSRDLGRTLDYLETRPDIRRDALAYLGLSWGSQVAPVMLATQNRFRAAILESGGLVFSSALPEAEEIHFLPRVRIPTLMINGRYDHFFPVETNQKPFLKLLGTPEADKRYVLYDSGHAPPRKELIRESLDWLDKYLGVVKR